MKLNFGCGKDYMEGFVNLDIDKRYNADIYLNKDYNKLPFKEEVFEYILLDNVLEHIPIEKVEFLFKELYRILKSDGILEIYVPHFKGIAVKYLDHHKGYGINSLVYQEEYFNIDKQELILISRNRAFNYKILRVLNVLNPLFNINMMWQQLCEKFMLGGFEEIHYILSKKTEEEVKEYERRFA